MADPSSEFMRSLLLITGNLRPKNQRFVLKLRNYLFTLCLVSFLVFCFNCVVFQNCYSWKDRIECLQYTTTGLHLVTKHFNLILNGKKVNKFLDDIDRLWNEAQKELPEKSLSASKKTKKITQTILYFYLGYIVVSISNILLSTIISNGEAEKIYLLKFWVPVDDYWTNFFLQLIITTTGLIAIAMDTGLVFYIAGKFEILFDALSKMVETSRTPQDTLRFLRYHSQLLNLVGAVNKLFSGQYALEMILSSVQIALRIYSTIDAYKMGHQGMYVSLFVALMALLAPFSLCYLGKCVLTKGENLQRSFYFSEWYKNKTSERKGLVIAQIMANKTITINYRNFMFFSYEEYLKLLQASYSYVMLTVSMEQN